MTLPSLSMTSIPRTGSKLRDATAFIPPTWAADVKKGAHRDGFRPVKENLFWCQDGLGWLCFSDPQWSPDTCRANRVLSWGWGAALQLPASQLWILAMTQHQVLAPLEVEPGSLTGFQEEPRGSLKHAPTSLLKLV